MSIVLMSGLERGDSLAATTLTGTYTSQTAINHTAPVGPWAGSGALQSNPTASLGHWTFRGWDATGAQAELAADTLYASVAVYVVTTPNTACNMFQILNSSGNIMAMMRINAAATVSLLYANGTDTVTNIGTTTSTIETGRWYTFELAVIAASSAGGSTVTARLDGAELFSASSLTIRSASRTCDRIRVGIATGSTTGDVYFDDLVGDDADWPGNVYIGALKPTADVTAQWATGTGTTFAEVDEMDGSNAYDSDTSYLGSSTSGNVYTASLVGGIPVPVRRICAVMPYVIIRDETGASVLNLRHISGATTTNLSTLDPGSSYVMNATILNTDPATGAAWTVAGVNAFVVGLVNGANVAARVTTVGAYVAFKPWNRATMLGAG